MFAKSRAAAKLRRFLWAIATPKTGLWYITWMVMKAMEPGNDALRWRKSSRSSSGACVEIAPRRDTILVRDSKDPRGPVLSFERESFAAFIAGVTGGVFDLPTP
jgi:hypothetical protein